MLASIAENYWGVSNHLYSIKIKAFSKNTMYFELLWNEVFLKNDYILIESEWFHTPHYFPAIEASPKKTLFLDLN